MKMKTAIVDTNVINQCVERAISADTLNHALNIMKLTPVVCPYTIYELARIILTNNPEKARSCFSFINDLNPEFCSAKHNLYLLEADKIMHGKPVNYLMTVDIKLILLRRINDYQAGIHEPDLPDFITTRQAGLHFARNNHWRPSNGGKIKAKYMNNFQSMLVDFINLDTLNAARTLWIQRVIGIASEGCVFLTDAEIFKLMSSLDSYPAFRTLLYSNLYLEFLTEINNATPAEDRYTDALIMIEGSYCTSIISYDCKLIDKHAKNINPNIESINLRDILN